MILVADEIDSTVGQAQAPRPSPSLKYSPGLSHSRNFFAALVVPSERNDLFLKAADEISRLDIQRERGETEDTPTPSTISYFASPIASATFPDDKRARELAQFYIASRFFRVDFGDSNKRALAKKLGDKVFPKNPNSAGLYAKLLLGELTHRERRILLLEIKLEHNPQKA